MCRNCNSYGFNKNNWYQNNNGFRTNNTRPANNGQQAQQTSTSTNPFMGDWKKQDNGAQTKDYDMGCSNVTLWGDNDGDDNVQVNNGVMTGNTMSSDESKYEKLRDYGDVMQIGDKYYMPPSQKEMDDLTKANGGCASKMWTELKGDDLDKYLKLKNGDTVVMGGDKAKDSGTAVLGEGGKTLPSKKEAEKILNTAIKESANKANAESAKREEISRSLSSEVAGTKSANEYNKELTEAAELLDSLGEESTDDDYDYLIDERTDDNYALLTNAGLNNENITALAKGKTIDIDPKQIDSLEKLCTTLFDDDPIKKALESTLKKAKEEKDKKIEKTQEI